jgi:hypothetical protein
MTDTIILHRSNGNDKYGEPLADTEVTVKGRVKIGTALVKDIKGENVFSSMSVLLKSQTLTHEDFVQFDGHEYAIIAIKKPRDFSWGYLEVFLK